MTKTAITQRRSMKYIAEVSEIYCFKEVTEIEWEGKTISCFNTDRKS